MRSRGFPTLRSRSFQPLRYLIIVVLLSSSVFYAAYKQYLDIKFGYFNLTLHQSFSVVNSSSNTVFNREEDSKFLTFQFGPACMGRLSNKLYEFMSLYGMARRLNRIPYIDASDQKQCVRQALDEISGYFPMLRKVFEIVPVNQSQLQTVKLKGVAGCCNYGDVDSLQNHSSPYINIDNEYFQSYKYFDEYRDDVLRLLQFTEKDIESVETLAKENLEGDSNFKLCVHTRRTDYVDSAIHVASTEGFTKNAALYVSRKLLEKGTKATIVLLGDDRGWLTSLVTNDTWAVVFPAAARPSIDYAFFARRCQAIILTAPASTFGFWSAYLSSAENVYYNNNYACGGLINEIVVNDFFPLKWIPLSFNKDTSAITELTRSP